MQPRVLLVCITADRHKFTARMLRAFRSQTYKNKYLFVLDSGEHRERIESKAGIFVEYMPNLRGVSIGNIRNIANEYASPACLGADIIAHLDVDDWSHPRRIEEQVALLESSGKDCVGFNEMLFWKAPGAAPTSPKPEDYEGEVADFVAHGYSDRGSVWRYHLPLPGYALGTSLCYWRRAWARHPFPDKSNGEDWGFLKGVSCESASALIERVYGKVPAGDVLLSCEPRMIATLHGSNTATRLDPSKSEWTREPEWDARVREILEKA